MELLIAALLVAVVWLILASARLAGLVSRHRLLSLAGAIGLLAAGWVTYSALQPGPVADYRPGDQALRAMLD